MENNKKQNRRAFFKEVTKRALPVLSILALMSNPIVAKAAELETTGCGGMCYSNCAIECKGGCYRSCHGSCRTTCLQTCSGSCSGRCSGSCQNSCSGYAY